MRIPIPIPTSDAATQDLFRAVEEKIKEAHATDPQMTHAVLLGSKARNRLAAELAPERWEVIVARVPPSINGARIFLGADDDCRIDDEAELGRRYRPASTDDWRQGAP